MTRSPQDTFRLGEILGKHLTAPAFIGLSGPLGAGKTLLAKAIAQGLGHNPKEVHSPTFTIMNIYEGAKRMYHFDFYRLDSPGDFDCLGLEEFFYDPRAVVLVEWAEKCQDLIPENALIIHLEFGESENDRLITLSAFGEKAEKVLKHHEFARI